MDCLFSWYLLQGVMVVFLNLGDVGEVMNHNHNHEFHTTALFILPLPLKFMSNFLNNGKSKREKEEGIESKAEKVKSISQEENEIDVLHLVMFTTYMIQPLEPGSSHVTWLDRLYIYIYHKFNRSKSYHTTRRQP